MIPVGGRALVQSCSRSLTGQAQGRVVEIIVPYGSSQDEIGALGTEFPQCVSSILGSAGWQWAALAMALGPLGLVWLSWDLHRFFERRGGPAFATGAAGLHWLYFIYSRATLAAVLALTLLRPHPGRGRSQMSPGDIK